MKASSSPSPPQAHQRCSDVKNGLVMLSKRDQARRLSGDMHAQGSRVACQLVGRKRRSAIESESHAALRFAFGAPAGRLSPAQARNQSPASGIADAAGLTKLVYAAQGGQ